MSSANIEINVKKGTDLEGYFADFSKDVINLNCVINLEEEGATTNFKLASLGANKDLKDINISVKHLSPKTYGRVDNYGGQARAEHRGPPSLRQGERGGAPLDGGVGL